MHKIFQLVHKKMAIVNHFDMGLDGTKPVFWGLGFANNTEVDQYAHPRSLIRVFVIHILESIISRLATSEISIF